MVEGEPGTTSAAAEMAEQAAGMAIEETDGTTDFCSCQCPSIRMPRATMSTLGMWQDHSHLPGVQIPELNGRMKIGADGHQRLGRMKGHDNFSRQAARGERDLLPTDQIVMSDPSIGMGQDRVPAVGS